MQGFLLRFQLLRGMLLHLLERTFSKSLLAEQASVTHADLDADAADANSYRVQQSIRKKLLVSWSRLPTSTFSCFMVVFVNAPVRELLHWILRNEKRQSRGHVAQLQQRYLFEPKGVTADGLEEPEEPHVPAFLSWISGKVTDKVTSET